MQHLFPKIILFVLIGFFWACEGPVGPPGPQGPDGVDGLDGEPGPEAVVIEYGDIDFVGPDYTYFLDYSPDYQPLKSDAVLVYALWESIPLENGEWKDVWRLLPQTVFHEEGTLVYNYDHTYTDVDLKMEANFDLSTANLGGAAFDNWVIRLVFIPGQDLFPNGRSSSQIDFSNYEEVKRHYQLPEISGKRQVVNRSLSE